MPRFITSIKFTAQGSAAIRETTKRAEAFKSTATKHGVTLHDIYWTLGAADGLIVFDAPDEDTATALMLNLTSKGNVQTQTSRAYNVAELDSILAKIP